MSDKNNDTKFNKDGKNFFEIMDEIINQLNNTKRLFIIMILTVMIIPPTVFIITFEIIYPSVPPSVVIHHNIKYRTGLLGSDPLLTITRNIPLIIGLIWLGIGIRQWIILSKWSKRYQRYKELQKEIEEKLDNEDELDNGGKSNNDNTIKKNK